MNARKFLSAVAVAAALALTAPATPAQATTGTWVWSRPIPHYYQEQASWCFPASFANQLASAGGTVDDSTQATLASEFKTDANGTVWANADNALNAIAGPTYTYDIRYVRSAADLMTEAEYSIDTYKAGLVAAVVDGALPYVNNPSDTTGHAILIYGYNIAQGAFYGWDPASGRGYEWITSAQLYAALQNFTDPLDSTQTTHGVYELERAQ